MYTQEQMAMMSLSQLGMMLLVPDEDGVGNQEWEFAINELSRRVDGSKEKALHFLKFHQNSFNDNPSSKNWNEVVALMGLHQHLSGKGVGINPAGDALANGLDGFRQRMSFLLNK